MIRARVLSPIKYNGVLYAVGACVSLDEQVFAGLVGVEVTPAAAEATDAPATESGTAVLAPDMPTAAPAEPAAPPPAPAPAAEAPEHVCAVCGRTFPTPQGLRAHMRAHKPR